MFFRQVQKYGDNFSYVVADEVTREAGVFDPSFNAGEIISVLKAERLKLKYVFNTHGHSDHTAGNEELCSMFDAKIVAHRLSRVDAAVRVDDGAVVFLGSVRISAIHTPGHTVDSICLLVNNRKLLTGDTLFVGECGRTDLPGGTREACMIVFLTSFCGLMMMWKFILVMITG
jgi:hydroxyacylglutathione hydrolase